jgi:ketosteroid isomerase-like protein
VVRASAEQVADELAVRAVLAGYCRGVDRRDWDLVRSCYHDDAHEDHGVYQGSAPGFVDWVRQRHEHVTQSLHVLGNVFVELRGDHAFVESYALTFQESTSPDGVVTTSEGACRYVDRFERRAGDWRIAARTMVVERVWSGRPSDLGPFAPGTRDGSDPSYGVRRTVLDG